MMPTLLCLSLIAVLYFFAYYLGPDDSRRKSFTSRETSASSIAVGLGFAVPFLWQSYHLTLLLMLGCVFSGVLTAAVAGRRPFLYSFLAGSLVTTGHILLTRLRSGSSYSLLTDILGALALALVVNLLPSVLLYPVWERRRRRIIEEQQAHAIATTHRLQRRYLAKKFAVDQSAQQSPTAFRPIISKDNTEGQILTRH